MDLKLIRRIVRDALEGKDINENEIAALFSVPVLSEEAHYIQHTARKMSEESNQGFAEVHAQVGLNLGPCPENCRFCSFAAINGIFKKNFVLAVDEVLEKCLSFERVGANAIYLLTTANFKFEEFMKISKEVRRKLKPETKLIANIGDFDYHKALALKDAGFVGVYHALRLGEGSVTGIKAVKRLKTFMAVKEAGLMLGTCVEPVGPEHSIEELVEKTIVTRQAKPVFSGTARRIPIPGTELSSHGMVTEARMAHMLAVVRLAMGYSVRGNCTHEPNVVGAVAGANLFWAEAGSNPRDIENNTEDRRGFTVEKCTELFRESEWNVLKGPSKMFGQG